MEKQKPFSAFSMDERVVIITGGAGFLGMQYARALGAAGAKVVLWDKLDRQTLDARATELQKDGICVLVSSLDITDEKATHDAARSAAYHLGRIDALINNAAMNPVPGVSEAEKQFAPYEDYPLNLWKQEVETNLTAPHICIQAVAPIMMKQRSGSIVNIASELSVIAYDHRVYAPGKRKSPGYITTKTGVLGLTRAWAAHLGEYGIRVNAFSPGGMNNGRLPEDFVKKYANLNMLGRMGRIGEYSNAIIFLCSDASSFMTGHNLVMDGGKTAW